MSRLAIWAQLEAKPGKEKEVEAFLKSAQPLAEREPGRLAGTPLKWDRESTAFSIRLPTRAAAMRTSQGK